MKMLNSPLRGGHAVQLMLFVLSVILIPFTINAQRTSPAASPALEVQGERLLTVTDTITFDELVSGTIVTDQYAAQGALFMGYDGSGDPETYDYGTGSFGPILHSDNWYNPIRMNFVDTIDSSFPAFAKKIEFDNPIDSEVDYISFKVYDENDNLIHSYMSTSPEHVEVEFDDYIASYVVFDDSLQTAYVIDNILLDISSDYVSVEEEGAAEFSIYPNPSKGEFNLSSSQTIEEIRVMDASGKQLEVINPQAKSYMLEINQPGVYFLMIQTTSDVQTQKVVVRN